MPGGLARCAPHVAQFYGHIIAALDRTWTTRAPRADRRCERNYYGAFYRSRLYPIALRIDQHLVRWALQKYKRLRGKPQRAWDWLDAVHQRQPSLFVH